MLRRNPEFPLRAVHLPVLLLGVVVAGAVQAVPEDRQQPVNLTADRAELNQATGVSVYEGNVIVTQGTMRLTGDRVLVYTKDGEFERMESFGKPTTFKQKPAADKEDMYGEALRLDYSAKTGIVIATTKAKVTQAQDVFTGDRIEYDVNKDIVRAQGKPSERVQIIMQPKPETPPKPVAPAAAAKPVVPAAAAKPQAPAPQPKK